MRFSLFIILLTSLFNSQLSFSYNAPIVDLEQPPSQSIKTHLVEQGETLYSIAWRYDLNVTQLAKINGLSTSYRLRRGQLLNIDKNAVAKIKPKTSATAKIIKTAKKIIKNDDNKKNSQVKKSLTTLNNQALIWRNPVKGKVTETYNPKDLRKGIEYKAKPGVGVVPAARGVVVYAGDGLRDYGKLVIIKHSDYLLSAYGHNQKLLVSEGQVVGESEIISKLGSTGRLYFEIRKNGKPVNPMAYIK
ncbi:peptidoglycan DD-metalloendopeptidase family protein [Porticoccaceae bacterium]|nr:peptidoglycan DD-metalloendopeptidase family protein [Porticoccaceae bacterium]